MRKLFPGICLSLLAVFASAAEPAFQPGVKLKAGGAEISIRVGHLVPVVTDWNGDKKKDLIVGHFTGPDGNIKLYLNEGTDAEPKLAKGVPMKAGGKPIKMDGG